MNKKAFTLLELIIVILIMGILTTLAVPQYQTLKEKAIATEVVQNIGIEMRRLEITYQSYGLEAAKGQLAEI